MLKLLKIQIENNKNMKISFIYIFVLRKVDIQRRRQVNLGGIAERM